MRHVILLSVAAALSPLGFLEDAATDSSAEASSSFPGVAVERAFGQLRFERPVFLTGCGDHSGRMFVVEQDGIIRVFDADEDVNASSVFLDISEHVSRRGNEEGLLGLAFHPDFSENGEFFVHFSSARDADDRGVARNAISRFTVSAEDRNSADAGSEEILLLQRQPYRNHNGGMIAFGPDGMLYASFGDGGAANDPEGNGQKLSSMLGGIIRIDVDGRDEGLGYAVPEDNPFVAFEGARPELWAIGLRNVWRFSFDAKTGDLFAGEVGQNEIEEVDIIVRGGNYGWNRFEADELFAKKTDLIMGEHIAPIATYPHSEGLSITGGYVYRGSDQPELDGLYFFADYVSGNLWATQPDGDGGFETELVRRTGRSVSSFGQDDDGELFALSFDGGIYRLVASEAPEASLADWPERLSDTGLYASMEEGTLAEHLVPYTVNAPFWSDDALKSRFVELPQGTQLGFREEGTWEVPVGARIVKTFHAKPSGRRKTPRPLETRVIERTDDGWEAGTYVWNRRGTEAELLPAGKQFEQWGASGVTTWHAPSSSECSSCHVAEAGYVLGLNSAQLGGGEQITKWIEAGIVELPEGIEAADLQAFHDPFGTEGTVEDRARTYLDVNCAMCHRPDGPGNAIIDLRYGTELAATMMLGEAPTQGDLGLEDAQVVSAGHPERSVLLHRVQTLGTGRMPNIGSNVVDERAVTLLTDWIESLE